jgi:hypothetical protein
MHVLKNGLELMVEAVGKVLSYVSDGMAKEWRVREKEEKEIKERATRLEDQREREARERKEKGKRGRG